MAGRHLTPGRITAIYAMTSVTWILVSDTALKVLGLPPDLSAAVSIAKGWLFVAVTTVALYALVRAPIRSAHHDREVAQREAHVAQTDSRILRLAIDAEQRLLRASSEPELFASLCRGIVEDPRFPLAWVGGVGATPERRVPVLAWAGSIDGYLDGLELTWNDEPAGRGPTGTSLRERRTVVCNDITTDPTLAPWRDRLLEAGLHASIALPIAHDGERVAVLTAYALEPGIFSPTAVAELERLAADIGFGVTTLRVKAERDRALVAELDTARALQELNDRYQQVISQAPLAVNIVDAAGRVVAWNPACEQLWGWTEAEVLGRTHPAASAGDDPEVIDVVAEVLAAPIGGPVVPRRYRRLHRDGHTVVVEVSAAPFRDRSGGALVLSMTHDVTSEVAAQDRVASALARIEGLHRLDRAILEAVPDETVATIAVDHLRTQAPAGRVALLLAAGETWVLAAGSGTGADAWSRPAADLEAAIAPGRRRIDGAAGERLRLALGDLFPAGDGPLDVVSIAAADCAVGALIFEPAPADTGPEDVGEILDEVAGQLTIAFTQARYRRRLESQASRLGLLHDIDGAIQRAESIDELGAYAVDALRLRLGAARVSLVVRDGAVSVLSAASDEDPEAPRSPIVVPTVDDGVFTVPRLVSDTRDLVTDAPWVQGMVDRGLRIGGIFPLLFEGRRVGHLSCFGRDERMLDPERVAVAEEVAGQLAIAVRQDQLRRALADREARLRATLDGSPNPVLTVERDGNINYASPATAAVFGGDSGAYVGRSIHELVPDDGREAHLSQLASWFDGAGDAAFQHPLDVAGRRRDGSLVPITVLLARLATPGGPQAIVTVVDLSERIAMEARLRQAERLEVLGQFAAILAHDVRNFFSAIAWSAELLASDLPSGDASLEDVQLIQQAVREGVAMTQSVLEFARPSRETDGATDLADHLRQLGGILSRIMPAGITIETDVPADLPAMRIGGTALTQVLINLATNARDSMPNGGRVRIAARSLGTGSGERAGESSPREPSVRLTVSDSGTGMDEATASRAFEPFFTTKLDGTTAGGTGLGLSSVFLIVAKTGGTIEVASVPGVGTTFTLDLPTAG